MGHTDMKTLLNRGRRAGLTTGQMYPSMNTRQPEVHSMNNSQADSNGFVARYDEHGKRVFEPIPDAK